MLTRRLVYGIIALPLWVKLLLAILVILTASIGAAAWTTMALLRRQLTEITLERADLLLQRIEKRLTDSMLDGGKLNWISEMVGWSYHDIVAVRILSPGGVVIKASSPQELGLRLTGVGDSATPSGIMWRLLDQDGGPRVLRVSRLVQTDPRCYPCHDSRKGVRGLLSVDVSFERPDHLIASSFWTIAGSAGITVVLASLSLWGFMLVEINRPLSSLARAMGRVERGDLTTRAPLLRRDEIGRLTEEFNALVANLEQTRRKVEEYHKNQLMRADQMVAVGELASSIAHEVKNPLAGIGSAVEVLMRGFPPGDSRREVSEEILVQVRRLQHVVRDLLDFSRPATSVPVPSDVNEVLAKVLLLLRPMAEDQGTVLVEKLGTDLPLLLLDPKQVQQVFLNIGMNALQAVEEGGEVVLLTALDASGQWVEVTVHDTGPGIPVERQRTIFEPFFTTKHKGTGLGLAIAEQIVAQHQGEITVRSQPGEGAAFTVRLPVPPAS